MSAKTRGAAAALGGLTIGCLALGVLEHGHGGGHGGGAHALPGFSLVFGLVGGAALAVLGKKILSWFVSRKGEPYPERPGEGA